MRTSIFALAMLGAVGTSACSSSADAGRKPGELGNGGFYFSCDDAVACSRYSNDAAKFPKAVSLGATFSVRFVSNSSNAGQIKFNESAPDRGITVEPIGAFVSRGPRGLVALKTGEATLISRDASGRLVDFVNVRVAKPDSLVVYAPGDVGDSPPRVDKLVIGENERRTFRAFAREKQTVLAGTLAVEWKSDSETVLAIESVNDSEVTVVGRAPGKTTLTAIGGTLPVEIPVEVTP